MKHKEKLREYNELKKYIEIKKNIKKFDKGLFNKIVDYSKDTLKILEDR